MGIAGCLSPHQLQSFHSQGFLVVESFATAEEIDGLHLRMDRLLEDFDCASTASIFSTKNQQHTTDNYFFDSAEKVSFFFEEKAFDDDGNLKQPKQQSINKVGHALHEIDPVFNKFSCSEKLSSLLKSLDYKRPVIIQSMYIFKAFISFNLHLICGSTCPSFHGLLLCISCIHSMHEDVIPDLVQRYIRVRESIWHPLLSFLLNELSLHE